MDTNYNSASGAYEAIGDNFPGGLSGGLEDVASSGNSNKLMNFAKSMVGKSKKQIREAGKKAGFTLIELLVVIAIISTLAGMLLPALSKAREDARRISCMNNERNILQAMIMYGQDYGNYPATGGDILEGNALYGVVPDELGLLISGNYIQTPKIFGCPSANHFTPQEVEKEWDNAVANKIGPAQSGYMYRNLSGGLTNYQIDSYERTQGGKSAIIRDCDFIIVGLHDYNHGNEYSNVGYVDGHVKGYPITNDNLTTTGSYDAPWLNADSLNK